MLKNLVSSLFLSERDSDLNERLDVYSSYDTPGDGLNPPKVKGRVITTLQKAKEARSLAEKCITIARRALISLQEADKYDTDAERHSEEWQTWRKGEQWQQWNQAIAPALSARRRAIQMLDNKFAVEVLFDEIAGRFADRDGGYTRVVRLAKPRLGDAGTRAILELVGVNDRVVQRSSKPAFSDEDQNIEDQTEEKLTDETTASVETEETAAAETTDVSENSTGTTKS